MKVAKLILFSLISTYASSKEPPNLIERFDGKHHYYSMPGYERINIQSNSSLPPKPFFKCPYGYLLSASIMRANSIVSIRPEFAYPRQIVILGSWPRADLGGVFIKPFHHYGYEESGAPENAAHLIFATMAELCDQGANGKMTGDSAREQLMLHTSDAAAKIGKFVYRAKGNLRITSPNVGAYFVAIWQHPDPKTGASFLICNTVDCKLTPAYANDRGFVYSSYQNERLKVWFDDRTLPGFKAVVKKNRTVVIE
jgi:hypothetical protein